MIEFWCFHLKPLIEASPRISGSEMLRWPFTLCRYFCLSLNLCLSLCLSLFLSLSLALCSVNVSFFLSNVYFLSLAFFPSVYLSLLFSFHLVHLKYFSSQSFLLCSVSFFPSLFLTSFLFPHSSGLSLALTLCSFLVLVIVIVSTHLFAFPFFQLYSLSLSLSLSVTLLYNIFIFPTCFLLKSV